MKLAQTPSKKKKKFWNQRKLCYWPKYFTRSLKTMEKLFNLGQPCSILEWCLQKAIKERNKKLPLFCFHFSKGQNKIVKISPTSKPAHQQPATEYMPILGKYMIPKIIDINLTLDVIWFSCRMTSTAKIDFFLYTDF